MDEISTIIFSPRIGPFRAFDTILTFLVVYLFAPLLTKIAAKFHLHIGRNQWLWLLIPISVLTHLTIKQETALTKMIIDPNNYHFVKFIVVAMFIMGIKDIRVIKSKKK